MVVTLGIVSVAEGISFGGGRLERGLLVDGCVNCMVQLL
jgi:hypothetical protein